jgi:transposase-like protein
MTRRRRYPVENRERAVRLALEHHGEYPSQWAVLHQARIRLGLGLNYPSLHQTRAQARGGSPGVRLCKKMVSECKKMVISP